jgi:RimJ/RimL family protein N-acetyltransferase
VLTERLRLEPFGDAHLALLAELGSLPEVVRHIGTGEPWTPERVDESAARQRAHWRDHGFGWRAAVERDSGRAVGFIVLQLAGEGTEGVDPREHEVGWWLHPDVWGRGLAREGAQAVLDEAFGRLGAPSVVAVIQPANAASIRVATALGLTHAFDGTGRTGEPVAVYRGLRPSTTRYSAGNTTPDSPV